MDNGNSNSYEGRQISKYDRLRGGLQGLALFTKPSTIKTVQDLTGQAETYIVETCRHEDGDYIFVECVDAAGVVRLVLPPRVADVVASQRDSLTARRRSAASKRVAAARLAAGWKPSFSPRGKKRKG